MLRHLTLTGEDSKDYLSRQASLCVKENSAYVVQGTETNDTNLKYHWRFEYAIDDRRDSAGKAIAGEKTLTPLNFACSPGLLHSTRGTGRKTTIMQQMKKTVWYSKVPAERMHAPTSPVARARLYAHGPLDHKHPSPKALPSTNHPVTPRPSHKRFHSAASPVAFPTLATTAPPVAPLRLRKKRDRAAFITDLPPAPPTLAGPSTGRSERRRSVTSPAFKVVRHIIPPSKLDELMTASPPQAYAPIFNGQTSPSLVMTPLSPPRRPSHNPPTSPDNDHLSAGASAGTHGQEGVQHRLVRPKRRLSWRA
ncbi:hypothetical protein EUX98_g783 [Antrodiella citrinella]|uniref:Uncharacterized protein n=1 Tax=Antrodiella citrinella TaxID=2447956 RepID=A0A4S4N355_9APHY|nr:hypothetical protein EUX98_g783 [Antrodiella citrinella]